MRDERGCHARRTCAEHQQVHLFVPTLLHCSHVHVSFVSFRRTSGFVRAAEKASIFVECYSNNK